MPIGTLVDRATSKKLIGPDWAMNAEICEILNREPGQTKDVVRKLKKRLKRKNPKVQMLALTMLESMMKDCSEIIHMHVAEKNIPHEMVKIVQKKQPDFLVRDKILVLIDTWQEALDGPRARYPQFFAAHQELLYMGVIHSQKRLGGSACTSAPPQPEPLSSHQSSQYLDYPKVATESSVDSDVPIMSLSDIEDSRRAIHLLGEMLNVFNHEDNKGHFQGLLVSLVDECRSYKQRVVFLVNRTSNEELLREGLAVNDELQQILARYADVVGDKTVLAEKPKSAQPLVEVADSAVLNEDTNPDKGQRSSTSISTSNKTPLQQLLLPAPPVSSGTNTPSARVDPPLDLLSFDDHSTTEADNSLALVPVSEPFAGSAAESTLALSEPQNNSDSNGDRSANCLNANPQQPTFYSNGSVPDLGFSPYQQAACAQGAQLNQANLVWNGQMGSGLNTQQKSSYSVNDQGGVLPPPPWEYQQAQSNEQAGAQPQPMLSGRPGGHIYPQPNGSIQLGGLQGGPIQNSQHAGMFPPSIPGSPAGLHSQAVQGLQLAIVPEQAMQGMQLAIVPQQPMQSDQLMGYGYSQLPNGQFYLQRPAYSYANQNEISQRMYALSMQDNSANMNSSPSWRTHTSLSYQQQFNSKPSKPEDKLFADLVNLANTKPK